MKRKRTACWLGSLALMICLGVGLSALGAKKPDGGGGGGGGGGVNPAAKLTVHDFYGDPLLVSDGNGPYVDWRLEDGDPCVFGWVKKDGFFFIYTNRGNDLGLGCEQEYPGVTPRRYVLKFPNADVCSALGLGSAPCEVPAERIRAEGLFGRRAQESPVAFMFYHEDISYSLDTIGDVSGSGDERTLTNANRTAQLMLIGQGPQPQPVGSPFVFSFEFTVERIAP
ncbi:MAG TPA: hypothetical protein VM182_16160 [Terriglobia bacterium]|nr:hypothetical protein [Terriglobia bacterium]